MKIRDLLITKETKGIFTSQINGYKIVDKGNLKDYINFTIPENASFTVINFNVNTKRLVVFLHVRGMSSEVIEVDYNDILDYTTINNTNLNTNIEAMVISDRVKYVLSKESIKTLLTYILVILISYLLGRL